MQVKLRASTWQRFWAKLRKEKKLCKPPAVAYVYILRRKGLLAGGIKSSYTLQPGERREVGKIEGRETKTRELGEKQKR